MKTKTLASGVTTEVHAHGRLHVATAVRAAWGMACGVHACDMHAACIGMCLELAADHIWMQEQDVGGSVKV